MKTFIMSHGSPSRLIQQLNHPIKVSGCFQFSTPPLSACWDLFLSLSPHNWKKLPLPLILGPPSHNCNQKQEHYFPFHRWKREIKPFLEALTFTLSANSLASPISKWLAHALVKLCGVNVGHFQPRWWEVVSQKTKTGRTTDREKFIMVIFLTASESPHKCLKMVVWNFMLT